MSDHDYLDHIRAASDARKPITRGEWQCLGVYAGLVAIAVLIAYLTKH